MSKLIDLSGKTFGLLTVIRKSHIINEGTRSAKTYWLCQCSCGKTHTVNGRSLRDGSSRSCGCYFMNYRKVEDPKMVSAYAVYNHPRQYGKSIVMKYSEADISFEKFLELSQKPCHYCGSPPFNRVNKIPKGRKNYDDYWFTYNGLDRIDSSKKHTIDNCVPCCFVCNTAKGNMTVSNFLQWVEKVYNHSRRELISTDL